MGVDNFTLFTSGGGGGGSASEFIQDAFSDISIPATLNTGFSSTVSTNPLNNYYLNNDAPKYWAKTLYVNDLVLVEDRSLWVNNKPTYRVVWNEQFPGVEGYAYGNIRLRNYQNGISVDVRSISDAFGVGGVIRRLQWILNPSDQATGTAALYTDGAATGGTATFGGHTGTYTGYNHFLAINHQASNETKDIHDFRIQANQDQTLSVIGVVVYFENATSDIDCFPGSTYVNKDKKTTSSITSLSVPAISGQNGGKVTITKTAATTYQANTLESPYLATVAVGSGGANTVTVTTGHGSSFPIGTGVAINSNGTSYFVGSVTNVSTDTLTLDRNLPSSVSGALWSFNRAGFTLPISATLYTSSFNIDFGQCHVGGDPNGFGDATIGNFYFSDPLKRFRIWGSTFTMSAIDGTPGIALGASSVLNIDGDYAAANITAIGATNAIFHATLTINGVFASSMNEGFSGVLQRTLFTDGNPGWKSVQLRAGSSMGNLVITGVQAFALNRAAGLTFGLLSEYQVLPNPIAIGVSSNICSIGTRRRVYADELYLTGGWGRTLSPTLTGGAGYQGASTNAVMTMGFFGKNYALIGNAFGASVTVTVDGSPAGATFNVINTVATEGPHTLVANFRSVTAVIEAVDFTGTKTGMSSLQNYQPDPGVSQAATVFNQTDTPRNPKAGDIWVQRPLAYLQGLPVVWIYLFGVWNRFNIISSSDDPNAAVFVRTHGSTNNTGGNAQQDAEHFNSISWSIGISDTAGVRFQGATGGNVGYQGFHNYVDGANSAGTITLTFRRYNKISWGAGTVRTNQRAYFSAYAFNGFLYCGKGFFSTSKAEVDKWNGSSWAASATMGTAAYICSGFSVNNFFNVSAGVGTTAHDTISTSDTTATATASPFTDQVSGSSNSSNAGGFSIDQGTTNSYVWNGSAWSSAVTVNYTADAAGSCPPASGFMPNQNMSIVNGGAAAGPAAVSTTALFNGNSWRAGPSSSLSREESSGSTI